MDSKWRLCGKNEENIYHIIASCPFFSNNLYLNNAIAKNTYDQVNATDNDNKEKRTHTDKVPPSITKLGSTEIWWDSCNKQDPPQQTGYGDLGCWEQN